MITEKDLKNPTHKAKAISKASTTANLSLLGSGPQDLSMLSQEISMISYESSSECSWDFEQNFSLSNILPSEPKGHNRSTSHPVLDPELLLKKRKTNFNDMLSGKTRSKIRQVSECPEMTPPELYLEEPHSSVLGPNPCTIFCKTCKKCVHTTIVFHNSKMNSAYFFLFKFLECCNLEYVNKAKVHVCSECGVQLARAI